MFTTKLPPPNPTLDALFASIANEALTQKVIDDAADEARARGDGLMMMTVRHLAACSGLIVPARIPPLLG